MRQKHNLNREPAIRPVTKHFSLDIPNIPQLFLALSLYEKFLPLSLIQAIKLKQSLVNAFKLHLQA